MRGTIIPTTLKSGKARYNAVIRHEGRQIWKRFDRRRDAERYLDSISKEIRQGTYKEVDENKTFGQYAEFWRNHRLLPQDYKPSTRDSYLSILDAHLLPFFQRIPLVKIDQAMFRQFETALIQGDRKRKTVQNILIILGKILKDAVDDNFLLRFPFVAARRKGKGISAEKQKGRALTPEEIRRLLDCCDDRSRLPIMFALLSGCRRGEQFAIEWSDIDFKKDVIHVTKEIFWRYGRYVEKNAPSFVLQPPKTEASIRDIDLSPALKKALQEYFLQTENKNGFVFSNQNGNPVDPAAFVRRHFKKAVRAAELGELRWHDLRHSYGSIKLDQGANIRYVMKQMGHSKVATTINIYGHLLAENNPLEAKRTDDFIFGEKSC